MPLTSPTRRLAAGLGVLALALTAPAVGSAQPGRPGPDDVTSSRQPTPEGYPRQQVLEVPTVDEGDASLRPGLTAYHAIAPLLNELQEQSDRVSAEVVGTTAGGRDIYLVTLTAPETTGEARRQDQLRRRILERPQQAAQDPTVARDYKVPVLVNANIHGNEWEGTDAVLELVRDYATSTDPDVVETLERTRISLVVSSNPDGRVAGTRANTAGFDLNRDFVTATQPETRAVRDLVVRTQPMLVLDLHGYVNGTLVEPTTPPHAENLELDLMLRHAYPNGLGIEQAVLDLGYGLDDGVRPPQVPFRDWDEGWDGWPPIFTPQYAALHGAVAHTVEVPLRINNASAGLPRAELARRADINTDIALAAVTATLEYAVAHRTSLVEDQVEWFRRGVTGAEQVPVTSLDIPGAGPEDVYLTDYPRGYVVPVGPAQRSAPAAARLVDHLVDNGVEVSRARRPVTVAGTTYPAGSYVVDMHQARRGIAGVLLGPGTDISPRVDAMYDISGWSHGLLWGADVVTVPDGSPLPLTGPAVDGADTSGELAGPGPWSLELHDPADAAALHDLLATGVAVTWTGDGTVVVPAEARAQAEAVVAAHGVALRTAEDASGTPVEAAVDVAVAATPGERWALAEMGFAVTPVSTASLNEGFDWSDIETLYVSSGLDFQALEEEAQEALTAFLADGGGLVARGRDGTELNTDLDALELTVRSGRSDANGVAAVDNSEGPLTAGAPPHTFVYDPRWFTDLGTDVVVDQRFATDDVLVAGHWRPTRTGGAGQEAAAGQPVVVHGVDSEGATAGARVVLLGSEPLFRAHPKGLYGSVARALLWSGAGDAERP